MTCNRKALAATLALAALMSLSACSTAPVEQEPVSELPADPAAGAYGAIAQPESISWLSHDGLLPDYGQSQWDAEYERLTGIALEHEYINGNEYNQRLRLYQTSGSLPDVFDLSYLYYPQYVADGAVADLTELVYASGLYDLVSPEVWELVSFGGRIYGVPKELSQPCGTYVRKDWLDRLDLDIPTTYEEFVTMLRRFRDEIEECQIPYAAPGVLACIYMPEFYLGASTDIVLADGRWVDGMQQDNMRAALANIQNAYAEGLLDVEALNSTTSVCRDSWMAGAAGCICYWAGNWAEQLEIGLKKNVPEAEMVWMPPIEGAGYYFSRPSVHVINGRLSRERIAQVFKHFIHFMHDGQAGQILFEYGVEGVHWRRTEQGIEMIFDLSQSPSLASTLNKAYILPTSRITPLADEGFSLTYSQVYLNSLEQVSAVAQQQLFQPPSVTYIRIADQLLALRNECVAEIVTGEMTVEEGLARYRQGVGELGLDAALEEMNAVTTGGA